MPRVLLLGSPPFAEPLRAALAAEGWLAGILTRPPKPRGRGLRVTVGPSWRPQDARPVPVWAPDHLPEDGARNFLERIQPEAAVLASFGLILPFWFLERLPRYRLNVHPSLLPRWRGAAPIPRTILAGDPVTGVTLHELTETVDAGPILAQERQELTGRESAGDLLQRLAELGATLTLRTLPEYVADRIRPQPQPTQGVTQARRVRPEEGVVDWQKSAVELERAARAFDPWPHLVTEVAGAPLILHRLNVRTDVPSVPAGRFDAFSGVPVVGTGAGVVELSQVQRPGRKATPGRAFLAGLRVRLPLDLPFPGATSPLR